MLQLLVRPTLPEPQSIREAATGTQALRETLRNPASHPDIFAAQLAWLKEHSGEAEDLLLQVADEQSFRPWTDELLRNLQSTSDLVMTARHYLDNWEYFRGVLGDAGFSELTLGLLAKSRSRQSILAGSKDATLAVAIVEATADAQYATQVRTWARDIVANASTDAWETELTQGEGGSLLDLALQLSGSKQAPSNPPGLLDALHGHAQRLASGQPAWQPDGNRFATLTGLLNKRARDVLASQLCASLEGRDGQISAALFATYGKFLAGEKEFRTHPKLPNVLERLVARDAWEQVEWFTTVAEEHPDTLLANGREGALTYLAERVSQKRTDIGDDIPDALTRLAGLLSDRRP